MDETTPGAPANPNDPTAPQQQPPPPAPRKRRRRWPWVILAIVVLLIVLVALLPTLLSTGAGKSIVLGQANNYVNGKVDIADWSIGWTSGLTINGLKIDDQQ